MSKFGLPHKANVGEIIRAEGYEGILFLVTEYAEEIIHGKDGRTDEAVTYTCRNIDNYKEIKIICDQDVKTIVVTADKSDEFIKQRQDSAQFPQLQKEDIAQEIIKQINEQFNARKPTKQFVKGKRPMSQHEQLRADLKEKKAYIDFLLDLYAMLATADKEIGGDESMREEMRLIEEEFHAKSKEIYGDVHKKG